MSDSAGVSPEFVQDLAQRVAKLRDLSEAGGFVLPAEITASLSKLRTSVLERQLGATPPSLSFDSEQYSDAGEKAEARRVKEAREEELRRMKEQSARLRASVHSRMSDFKSECEQFVERSMRTSFEVTSYRQELQRIQATSLDQRPPTPESSLLGASDRVKEMQREVNALKATLQARQQVGRENEQLRELIKQMELAVERQKSEKAECKLHCALL